MEQDVNTTAASRLQDSQRGLCKVVREAELGRGQASVIVRLRALCCPVLSIHLSFGLAPQTGQRTDNICLSEMDFKTHRDCPALLVLGPAGKINVIPRHVDSLPLPLECGGCP